MNQKEKKPSRKVCFFKKISWPEYIFGFALIFLILSAIIFYLVDLRNFLGLRDYLFAMKPDYFYFTYRPFFFQHWGSNGGPAEVLQWLSLAGSALGAAYIVGILRSSLKKKINKFWLLMSFTFILMLFEDAGDVRHMFMSYIQALFKEAEQGIAGTGFELIYFSILGGLPLYALLRYGGDLRQYAKTKVYIIIGFVFYFFAGTLSFAGSAFSMFFDKNFYTIAGEKFYQFCLKIGDPGLAAAWQGWENAGNWSFPISFFIMDSTFEEALEIVGAAAFLAAVVSFYLYQKNLEKKIEGK